MKPFGRPILKMSIGPRYNIKTEILLGICEMNTPRTIRGSILQDGIRKNFKNTVACKRR